MNKTQKTISLAIGGALALSVAATQSMRQKTHLH